MSALYLVLSIIGALFALATLGGGLWAMARSAANEASMTRLRTERDDYLSRLNFIEPRHRAAEQQNELLLALHDPTEKLDGIAATTDETLKVLKVIESLYAQIDLQLYRPRKDAPNEQ